MKSYSGSSAELSLPTEGRYDYIIAGAGCAGLSLAMHMIDSGSFSDKKILLVDREPKRSNDRTWCFWEKEEGLFESITYHQWQQLWFHGTGFSSQLDITPYRYKMIRGIDFYEHCLGELNKHANFTLLQTKVDDVINTASGAAVKTGERTIEADYVFNSILFHKPALTSKQYWLLQHFKGWVIETEQPVFDPAVASLMDFRTDQRWGTAFCYVLPFSSTTALIEYTIFSPEVLTDEQYEQGLQNYVGDVLKAGPFRVVEKESGVIPMTNFIFSPGRDNIINIGTAGGQTKGSSGYTFNFIQKHSAALVAQIKKSGKPFFASSRQRFGFYDSVLLNILFKNKLQGKDIFTDLFKKNKPSQVLKFLDNETSIAEELKIISSLPYLPFMKAAVEQVF